MTRLDKLTKKLQHKVPMARLSAQTLPLAPSIKLALIEETYPQSELSPKDIEFLMDEPPYWAFCWASGQVLAKYLIDNPREVKNRTVVDFGSGSGVVGIAAKQAGAAQVFAVDSDPTALLATQVNSRLNQVEVKTYHNLTQILFKKEDSILLIADVFYDSQNIPMLSNFLDDFNDVIIADSRVAPQELTGVEVTDQYESSTVPDLGESIAFNSVSIYRKR